MGRVFLCPSDLFSPSPSRGFPAFYPGRTRKNPAIHIHSRGTNMQNDTILTAGTAASTVSRRSQT